LTPHCAVSYKDVGAVMAEADSVIRSMVVPAALLASAPAFLASGSAAQAGDQTNPPPSLPSLALDPQAAPSPSIWKGLYVGADVFFAAGSHSKGVVGGGAFVGYDKHFDNNLVLGIQASTGFVPFSIQHSPFKGYDYGEVSAKVGYEMGRVTPYLATGIVLARPNGTPGAGYLSPADSANNLFNNGGSNLSASGIVGAGVDYALTDKLTVGVAATVGTGRGFVAPP
jgi:opacity protein-like surface antigen